MDEITSEVWSEYARIKHMLLDYDQNFREALSNAYLLARIDRRSQANVQILKAQKHVGLIFDLAMVAGAFPADMDEKDKARILRIATGDHQGIDDLQWAQTKFREWYQKTGFYNITISKDNRPAIVRKYK